MFLFCGEEVCGFLLFSCFSWAFLLLQKTLFFNFLAFILCVMKTRIIINLLVQGHNSGVKNRYLFECLFFNPFNYYHEPISPSFFQFYSREPINCRHTGVYFRNGAAGLMWRSEFRRLQHAVLIQWLQRNEALCSFALSLVAFVRNSGWLASNGWLTLENTMLPVCLPLLLSSSEGSWSL